MFSFFLSRHSTVTHQQVRMLSRSRQALYKEVGQRQQIDLYTRQSYFKLRLCCEKEAVSQHTNVDGNIESFTLASNLASLAVLAAVAWIDSFALSLALMTHRLDLLNEAWQQLLNVDLCARTTAASAQLHGSLSTTAT